MENKQRAAELKQKLDDENGTQSDNYCEFFLLILFNYL